MLAGSRGSDAQRLRPSAVPNLNATGICFPPEVQITVRGGFLPHQQSVVAIPRKLLTPPSRMASAACNPPHATPRHPHPFPTHPRPVPSRFAPTPRRRCRWFHARPTSLGRSDTGWQSPTRPTAP